MHFLQRLSILLNWRNNCFVDAESNRISASEPQSGNVQSDNIAGATNALLQTKRDAEEQKNVQAKNGAY